jgi:hypothetical protein
MAVHPASLEVLEKAAVPPAQARAILQAIEIEIAGAKDTLATKQDTLILRHDMAEGRAELRTEIAELRRELREKLGRSEFQAAMVSQVRHTYGAIMGAIMGQFALLLGAAYFFITHVQR